MADGSVALLSPLGAEDRDLLSEGLELLSIESRYTRFGQGRSGLTNRELDYLARVDQRSHVAWGAAVDGEGAGVGRYIRLDDQGCAEIAVTVLDEYQQRGLGSLLFEALVAVARADGIEVFCFAVVPGNAPVEHMIRDLQVKLDQTGSLIEGRLAIADLPVGSHEAELVAVIDLARG